MGEKRNLGLGANKDYFLAFLFDGTITRAGADYFLTFLFGGTIARAGAENGASEYYTICILVLFDERFPCAGAKSDAGIACVFKSDAGIAYASAKESSVS